MTARFNLLFAALLAAGSVSGPAVFAQDVDFGDDSGQWTRDGECDDPRFEGPGMAASTDPSGVMTDASDCRKAFTNGLVTLMAAADTPVVDEAPVTAGIDFGGDTGTWINDGECDDPRFAGPGMSAAPIEADILGDASDCRALFDAGQVQMAGDMPPADDVTQAGGIDFGGDTSPWVNDGECDDPRFEGPGMAQGLDDSNILGDASDCRALYDAGQVMMAGDLPAADDVTQAGGIDFGGDTSPWVNDGECDDPRFEGPGMAQGLDDSNILGDASDCRALYDAGQVMMAGDLPAADDVTQAGGIDFGGDTSPWVNDGECDDPRFEGPGMAQGLDDSNILGDASDCRALYDAGQVMMAGGAMPSDDTPPADDMNAGIDFGGDTSPWINDGECDDPRFEGPGMAQGLDDSNILGDASDCRALYDAGQVMMAGGAMPADDMTGGEVDFGADSGQWTFDGECDDPRFAGEGMADVLQDADLFADATDCRTLYEAGMITLTGADMADQGGGADPMGTVDFGADSGQWTLDGECDDPRFVGEGMADVLQDVDLFADATDCRTLFEAGMISLADQ